MRPVILVFASIVLSGSVAFATADAGAATVQSSQHFVGIVNGNHTGAVVEVVCPGPVRSGETGHPAGGQYLAAIRWKNGSGFTGDAATSIDARFQDDPSAVVRISTYGVGRTIPTALSLPCSGKGTVRFAPSPTSSSAVRYSVTVTYENIAV